MVKVSVVVPVYNAARYLHECIDSILGQTLEDTQIICVDDASTDGSPAILQDYAERDARLEILVQECTQFAGAARNRGLEAAKGKYLVFWDADDFFEPDALEKLYLQCEKDAADICICGGRVFDMATQRFVASNHFLDLDFFYPRYPYHCLFNGVRR